MLGGTLTDTALPSRCTAWVSNRFLRLPVKSRDNSSHRSRSLWFVWSLIHCASLNNWLSSSAGGTWWLQSAVSHSCSTYFGLVVFNLLPRKLSLFILLQSRTTSRLCDALGLWSLQQREWRGEKQEAFIRQIWSAWRIYYSRHSRLEAWTLCFAHQQVHLCLSLRSQYG